MIATKNRLSSHRVLPYTSQGASFNSLIESLEDYPPLAAEEERALATQAHSADAAVAERARTTLVLHNIRLVLYLAKKYCGPSISLSELVDEGVIGLIEAAGRYDGRNESRFATYAGFYIERDLRRALARASQVIRIPPYVTTLRGKIKRYINTFTTEHGREPTFDEIQVALGVPASELGTALHTRYSVVSLDSLDDYDSTAGGDGVSLLESLQDHTPPVDETALDHMEQSDLYDRLRRLLTPRELLVIAYRYRLGTLPRYGVDDDDDLSGVEVAARLGVSRQTVFNLEASALAKLRQAYGVSFERALAGRAEQATVR